MMKKIVILGSTGSIGTQTLEVVRNHPDMNIIGLSCGSNIDLLEKQIREFKPLYAVVDNLTAANDLALRIKDCNTKVTSGMNGLCELAACKESDTLVTAVVGMLGLRPTIAAIREHKTICLANKETLVTAGHLIMPMVKENNVSLFPVDSEHSAIFQCLQGNQQNEIERILLTASGGPFLGKMKNQLIGVSVEETLKHPNWSMGRKISVDSATMVNKGLEVIEAMWLFGVTQDQIQVVIHPQSIVHSMVEFTDGAVIAQLGTPDMKLPIQYALTYPVRRQMSNQKLDFYQMKKLEFSEPNMETSKGLQLAFKAIQMGGNAPTIYNAANEVAVEKFLNRELDFLSISDQIELALLNCKKRKEPSVDEILDTQLEVIEYMNKLR